METKIKTFEEIAKINVSDKIEKKQGLSYLTWSYAWAEIKKIDSNANYLIHENAEGNAFFESKFGIDCKVSVTLNGVTHTMRLPVMDGANKSMKAEAYKYTTKFGEKSVEAASAFDINKTIMRCLVKAIAMHGLGLYIYAGEDLPETTNNDVKTEIKTDVKSVKEEVITPVEVKTEVKVGNFVKVEAIGYKNDEAKAILKDLGFRNLTDKEGKWHTIHSNIKFDSLPKVPGITFKVV